MTVATPPRPPSAPSSAPVDAEALEALIEEARTRARRRRQAYGLASRSDIDWAPDGRRLAYACDGKITIVDARLTRTPRLLSTVPGYYSSPTWSPAGGAIAFAKSAEVGKRAETAPGIYVASVRPRTQVVPVLMAHGWAPAWSPDGTKIAFRAGCGGIKLITPSGADVTPAWRLGNCRSIGVGGLPVWSPDGAQIAIAHRTPCLGPSAGPYCVGGGVYVMRADGSRLRLVTREMGTILGGGRPTWRPRPSATR